MIQINLNLLPPAKKNRLKYLIKFIFSNHILEVVIFMTSIVAIALLWSWIVLQDGYSKLAAASILVNKEYAAYNAEIKELNILIKNINKTTENYDVVTPNILNFTTNLPKDIRINSFSLDRKTNILAIQGVATTRQALLDYQDKLRSIEWIEFAETPKSKLFQKENISFEINAKVKNIKMVK